VSLFNKKSSADFDEPRDDNAGNSKVSLLILLLLVGAFAYLYFFTSLIVPHETAAPKAPEATPEVKQSMPPRPAETGAAAPAPVAAGKAEETKPAAAAAPAPPAAQPAAKPAAPAPAAAKPAPAQQPSAVKTAQPAPAPPAVKAVQPAAPKKAEPPAAKAVEAKPAVKKDAAKSTGAAAPAKTAAADKPLKKQAAAYVIVAGELPAGADVAAAEAKLEKHGVKPVLKQVSQKGREMNRLFVNSFSDYDAYASSLEKLKQTTRSAFGIEKDGKYNIYAGSFSSTALAQAEKKRLQDKGVKAEIQKTVLPGTTVKVTAGSFPTKAAADKAAAALAKDGLAVRVIPKGK